MTELDIMKGLLFAVVFFVGGSLFMSLFYTKVGRMILVFLGGFAILFYGLSH
jgi:hypothetical protein